MSRPVFAVLVLAAVAAGGARAEGLEPPVAVAPGAVEAFEETVSHCPTFHWGGSGEAGEVELVVYRLGGEAPDATAMSSPELRLVLPGAARGWTPSRGECLKPGGRYAWALRATERGAASEWSAARLFRVPPAPSSQDVAAAIEVLRRYVAAAESPPAAERVAGLAAGPPDKRGATESVSRPVGTDPATIPGSAAFRAQSADTTGESHGVVGVSRAPDGFGLAGENTAGGTDLLLAGDLGSPHAELTEAFLDRPSDDDQTFDVRNSLAGTMTLRIDGVEVVTTATDADTLGGLSCAPTQVAQWDGLDWVCATTGTDTLASLSCAADQITRFGGTVWECSTDRDTLAGLTCAPDEVAQWNGAAWDCATPSDTLAGLACAADQVVHWDGAAWACGQPQLTYQTCSDSGFPGDCTVNCPAGSIAWTGGCSVGGNDFLTINQPTGAASGPSGWRCQAFDLLGSSSSVTGTAYCVVE